MITTENITTLHDYLEENAKRNHTVDKEDVGLRTRELDLYIFIDPRKTVSPPRNTFASNVKKWNSFIRPVA